MTDRRLLWLAAAVLGAVYLPILAAPFLWDDRSIIAFNAAWDRPIPLGAYLRPAYFAFSTELTWRPAVSLSYEALMGLFGRVPAPWRAAGLALHVLNGALLGLFLKRAKLPQSACLLAGALFLAHPVHIETLQVVTFNEETFAALGLLLMLLAHQARKPWLAAGGLGLALLSKETALMGLPLLALYDSCFARKDGKAYGPPLVITAAYAWVRFSALPGPGGGLSVALPWTERLFYAAEGLVTSALLLAAPIRLRIEYFALPPTAATGALWLAALLALLAGAVLLARRLWSEDRRLAFLLAWPFLFLAVTSNLLPTGVLSTRVLAERWLYIPFLGACALIALPLSKRPRLAAALIVFWGGLGVLRARDWASDEKLWSSLARVYPWSSKAHEGLGEAYFRDGRFPEALSSFQKAAAVRQRRQDLVLAHYVPLAPPGTIAWESASLQRWLGLATLETGDLAASRRHLEKAQGLQPADRFTYRALAYACARAGDFAAARRWAEQGLALDPADDFLLRLKADAAARKLSFQARF